MVRFKNSSHIPYQSPLRGRVKGTALAQVGASSCLDRAYGITPMRNARSKVAFIAADGSECAVTTSESLDCRRWHASSIRLYITRHEGEAYLLRNECLVLRRSACQTAGCVQTARDHTVLELRDTRTDFCRVSCAVLSVRGSSEVFGAVVLPFDANRSESDKEGVSGSLAEYSLVTKRFGSVLRACEGSVLKVSYHA